MKKDAEVRLLRRERQKGATQAVAAARAGMSERTARKYERLGGLPSQMREPRRYRTRPDPFLEDWPWVRGELERDPALQGVTLFGLLCARRPGRYQESQLRTLQRHIQRWRALAGPEREVMFAQRHEPGEAAQSDFTHMEDLGVTLGGAPFPHLLFHLVLTYSNVEAITLCSSESFEALAEGIERCLWQVGGVPRAHRTDQLTAAVQRLDAAGRREWNARYAALLAHYGMAPSASAVGEAHQNGDVEQSHYRFKQAVDQALRVRGHRDFADRAGYERFLQELVTRRNRTRAKRLAEEQQALRPLPAMPLLPCRGMRATVGRGSTIQVLGNGYSVPSRLIGATLTVRVRAETLDAYLGTALAVTLPRLAGHGPPAHRLPPHRLVARAQARRLRRLPPPRRALPHPLLPAGLRPPARGPARAGRPRVCARAAPGGQHDRGRRRGRAGAAPRGRRRADPRRGARPGPPARAARAPGADHAPGGARRLRPVAGGGRPWRLSGRRPTGTTSWAPCCGAST